MLEHHNEPMMLKLIKNAMLLLFVLGCVRKLKKNGIKELIYFIIILKLKHE
jgi:hypothetical protein